MAISVNDSMGRTVSKIALSPFSIFDNLMQVVRISAVSMLTSPKDQFDHGANAGTVILLPGFTQGSASMSNLGEEIGKTRNVAYVDQLSWYTASVKTLIDQILLKINEVRQLEKNGDISLVGHSF